MKTLLLGATALAATVAVPGLSLAATFAYVDQAGQVQTIAATSAAEAIATAPNIDENSGALLVNDPADQAITDESVAIDGAAVSGTAFGVGGAEPSTTYAYVDQAGEVQTVIASSPVEAIATAPNIDENSGALLVNDPADQAITDERVNGA